jgi:hypothetical protein
LFTKHNKAKSSWSGLDLFDEKKDAQRTQQQKAWGGQVGRCPREKGRKREKNEAEGEEQGKKAHLYVFLCFDPSRKKGRKRARKTPVARGHGVRRKREEREG